MHSPTERRALADARSGKAPRPSAPGRAPGRSLRLGRRVLKRRDPDEGRSRDHHELEPGRGRHLRLHGGGGGRPAGLDPDPGAPRGEERRILDRVLAGEHMDHYETERVTKDGRLLVVSLSASPIRDESGEVVGASVIGRDITDSTDAPAAASRP